MVTVAVPLVGVSASPSMIGPLPRTVEVVNVRPEVITEYEMTVTVVVARHLVLVVELRGAVPIGPVPDGAVPDGAVPVGPVGPAVVPLHEL